MGTDTDAVLLPLALETIWLLPPFMVYVNVYGVVPFEPVKVTCGAVAF